MSQISIDQEKTELIGKIKQISFKINKIVESTLSGDHHSLFKGQGVEFDEVREYVVGDDVKSIDWNVTGRMNSPFVKRYHEERELVFNLLFDQSASHEFGSILTTKNQVATEIAAAIAFSIIKNKDKVGFLSFSDRVEHYLAPSKGRSHGFKIIGESLFHRPSAKRTDLAEALRFLSRIQKKRSVVFIISDFLYPVNYEKWLRILAKKHTIFALIPVDPLESNLEDLGLVNFRDEETGERVLIDSSSKQVRKQYQNFFEQHHEHLKKIFFQYRVRPAYLNTGEDYFKELSNCLRKH